jgi:transposase InsO family protein
MPAQSAYPAIPLPRAWSSRVKSGILHVLSLAQFTLAYTRGWAADSVNTRVRLRAELDRAVQENALLREEIRIKDLRMAQIPPHRRPFYPPTGRMAILEAKAARNWSLEQTAKAFLVTAATIASWMRRVDEQGPNALVQLPVPVNKFPDFVRYAVQRLKVLCPMLGKVKIAQILARAGLHLGPTTVGRILKEEPAPKLAATQPPQSKQRIVTSKHPNHLWMADLTTVSISSGFWASWLPFSLPQCWPFCWWIGLVIDHYSRRIMGVTLFWREPTSEAVRAFLGRVTHFARTKPRHLVTDKGPQFWNRDFKLWCRRKSIKPRFGAIGQHGSIAVGERLILTLKQGIAWLPLVSLRRETFREELLALAAWYNAERPHMSLGGQTPDEAYHARFPANRKPRFEPRPKWPRGSPCARPWALVKDKPGIPIKLDVELPAGRRHLPIVHLRRAA